MQDINDSVTRQLSKFKSMLRVSLAHVKKIAWISDIYSIGIQNHYITERFCQIVVQCRDKIKQFSNIMCLGKFTLMMNEKRLEMLFSGLLAVKCDCFQVRRVFRQ